MIKLRNYLSLREKCPYSELLWSVFSRIRTEYREILRISLFLRCDNPPFSVFSLLEVHATCSFSYEILSVRYCCLGICFGFQHLLTVNVNWLYTLYCNSYVKVNRK